MNISNCTWQLTIWGSKCHAINHKFIINWKKSNLMLGSCHHRCLDQQITAKERHEKPFKTEDRMVIGCY